MTDPETQRKLAEAHAGRGEFGQAVDMLLDLLDVKPGDIAAVQRLGELCLHARRVRDALPHFERAIAAAPDNADLLANHATLLGEIDRDKAAAAYRQALEINPDQVGALAGLAGLLRDAGSLAEAEKLARRAVELRPDLPEARVNLGAVLTASGRADDAVVAITEAIRAIPRAEGLLLPTMLSALNYSAKAEPAQVAAAHRRFGQTLGITPPPAMHFPNDRDPDRIIKVALISPDLRAHSVAFFIEPLLKNRKRHEIEITCIFSGQADVTTKRLRNLADHWIDARDLPDGQLVERIRAARIDIAIELSGHTSGDRLRSMAARGAPVQMTYCGYPNTTGIPAIDYRIVDSITDPPGSERSATERLIRLDPCFLCYQPPQPADLPAATQRPTGGQGGSVVFGSFNAVQKISPPAFDLWSAILKKVPGSRLLLKSGGLKDASVRERVAAEFAKRAIDGPRLELVPWAPTAAEGLAMYNRVDMALDTFPYNGTTTTCEAMLMGTPVITLRGKTHAGRVGASLLAAAGLPDFIAETPEQYEEIAVKLASDADRRADLHAELRDKLLDSPLCDGPAFCRGFEKAMRQAWAGFCQYT